MPTKTLIREFIGTSLVVQWLRFHAPEQGTWLLSLVRELDPTYHN